MERRDSFLRAIVASRQPTAPLVANLLRENSLDDEQMRNAIQHAFACLGYEVSRLAGRTKPNAIAAIRRSDGNQKSSSYALAIYAATTDRWESLMRQLATGRVTQQKGQLITDVALIVVPDRPRSAQGAASAADLERLRDLAQKQNVAVLSASDLSNIVVNAATRGMSFLELRELFEQLAAGGNAHDLITSAQRVSRKPILVREMLETTWEIQRSREERAQSGMIVERSTNAASRKLKTNEIEELFRALRRLVGPLITVEGRYVSLEATPETILAAAIDALKALPQRPESVFQIRNADSSRAKIGGTKGAA
jgi:hypothetical protein